MKQILVFILLMIVSTAGLFLYQYYKFHDGLLHVVFCSVGQGDAVFIRTPNGTDIIYDGGPDPSVLSCLTEHMPFWDRSIEQMFLSHPHADHLVGLNNILKRYTVLSFDTEKLSNPTGMYAALLELLKRQKTHMRYILAGDTFETKDGLTIHVLSPTMSYLHETSPGGTVGEKKEFASLILQLSYGDFDVLLTGDSQKEVFARPEVLTKDVEVLQSPHHGSRTGIGGEMLQKLQPELVVISVGKNNYGHPHKETLSLLQEKKIKVLRTDKAGSIEIVSNGKKWWLRSREATGAR